MKTEIKPVKTKGQEVGAVEIPVYENLEELMAVEKPEYIVEQFNKANTITLMNAERNQHMPEKLGKTKKNKMAYNLCTPDELMSVAGDYDKLQALLESKMPQVEAQLAAEAKA